MKKVIFLIFFALFAISIATVQSVKGVSLDAFSARTHEEQILPQKFNTRLDITSIQYEHNQARPNWGREQNRIAYRTICKVVKELAASSDVVHTIIIEGGASPVGSEQYNHELAYNRAKILRDWVAGMEGGDKLRIYAISAGEDWGAFAEQIHKKYNKANREQVLAILNSEISNDEKEERLFNLDNGKTWKVLVDGYMGPARNAAVVRIVENEPLASYTRKPLAFSGKVSSPELVLPLLVPFKKKESAVAEPTEQAQPKAETTAAPVVVEKGATEKATTKSTKKATTESAKKATTKSTEKVATESAEKVAKESVAKESVVKDKTEKEKVVEEKPAKEKKEKPIKVKDSVVVVPRIPVVAFRSNLLVPALNAGIEVPIGKHWSVGADYYFPWIWPKKDNKNCFELLAWGIEGRYWFGKNRTLFDRLKGHSVGLYGYVGYYDFERNFHGHQGEFLNVGVDYTYAMAVGKRKALHLEFSLGLGYIYSEARQYTVIEANGPLISDKITKKVGYFGPTKANVSLVVPIFQKVKPSNKDKGDE